MPVRASWPPWLSGWTDTEFKGYEGQISRTQGRDQLIYNAKCEATRSRINYEGPKERGHDQRFTTHFENLLFDNLRYMEYQGVMSKHLKYPLAAK